MITLSDRSSTFTDSVIRRMSRVCAKYGALNLAQGFPDYNPPEPILERLSKVAFEGPHQYATTWGAQNFREALCEKVKHFSGLEYDPNSEVCVTCGGTEAMMASVLATINPGDKVAIFSPFYENYGADAILSGAQPIFVPPKPPSFDFDPEELRAAFRQGAKALILCNPSNPSGKVFTREELLKIAEIVKEFDAFVIRMKSMSTLSINPMCTPISRHCRACASVRLSAIRSRRLIPLRAGVWVTFWGRPKLSTESVKSMTF